MNAKRNHKRRVSDRRDGAVAPLIAILMIPMLSMVAFMVDYGYLGVVKSDLQRSADAAVLAGVMDLIPDENGVQNFDRARQIAVEYANLNMGFEPQTDPSTGDLSYQFKVLPGDIVTGKYDPSSINGRGPLSLDTSSLVLHDTMQITLRRDNSANSPVTLFFAQLFGVKDQSLSVTSAAVLRKPTSMRAGGDILPFALPLEFWNQLELGEELSIYNDNKIEDGYGNQVTVLDATGNRVPGNWGTVDIGPENNSTKALGEQILYGLKQSDIDALYDSGRIPTNLEIPLPFYAQADPGLSAGIKDDVIAIHGQTRLIPIYDSLSSTHLSSNGGGNNAEFHVVRWGEVKVLDSHWQGNKNTKILARKTYTYNRAIRPREDLSDTSDTGFDGLFTTPVLVR
jgi:Putative Flp pilus-assembly TadE/G-like